MLVIELHKIIRSISPSHMSEIFKSRNQQRSNLMQSSQFLQPMAHSVFHGTESLAYLNRKTWGIILEAVKNIDSFFQFKKLMKKWKLEYCPCRIYKVYIPYISFT